MVYPAQFASCRPTRYYFGGFQGVCADTRIIEKKLYMYASIEDYDFYNPTGYLLKPRLLEQAAPDLHHRRQFQ